MVAVTERAKERLLEMKLAANISEPEVGLRLKPAAGGEWGLVPDRALEGDQVVEYDGSKVLLVAADASEALGGRQVDCRETETGEMHLVLA
jgi:Fe-S cluster assembly iron-binding protein IscA